MKYEIGNKIKIRTWEEMEKEYGLNNDGNIDCRYPFTKNMEIKIEELNCDRILTIRTTGIGLYSMKEIEWCLTDDMMKCLVEDDIKSESITSRFDILDIR